jgi:hypothetical protein
MDNDLHRRSRRRLVGDPMERVSADQKTDPPPMSEDLFTKIQLRFKDHDQAALDQIRAAARTAINETFAGLLSAIDEFYMSFRKAKTNDYGVIVLDNRNRVVFATDEQGRYVDDFSCLSGQDVEIALLKIHRDKVDAVAKVKELFQEALFAKHIYDDAWHERYEALLEGTIKDREARADRDTKQFKYHAYFTYFVYCLADGMFDEIKDLARILERIRQWRIQDSYTERSG